MKSQSEEIFQMKRGDIPKIKIDLMKKQKGLCLICNRNLYDIPSRDVCLDHNHQSWRVRAVICRQCNILEAKIHKLFIRTGAKNKGIDFILFLKGLIKFQKIEDTNYIYPEKSKKRKSKKTIKKPKVLIK